MEEIKIQKYFTDCGIMSRRAAENEIKLGRVKINGSPAQIGQRINPETDTVSYMGKEIKLKNDTAKRYIMLNKPRGFVTSMSDEKGRQTVADLVADVGVRVYPVGRLDMDSDGMLIMTSDGELANILTHPRHEIPKIYEVTVSGKVTNDVLLALGSEMMIDGYKIMPVKSELLFENGGLSVLRMTLFEGRNRQIRKMCDAVGLKIKRLSRVAIGEIKLGTLKIGAWRNLSPTEIEYLKSGGKQRS